MEVTIMGAENLRKVNTLCGRMRTYAVLQMISKRPNNRENNNNEILWTEADDEGNKNPVWNAVFKLPIENDDENWSLKLSVFCKTKSFLKGIGVGGDTEIGSVTVGASDLIQAFRFSSLKNRSLRFLSYKLTPPCSDCRKKFHSASCGVIHLRVRMVGLGHSPLSPQSLYPASASAAPSSSFSWFNSSSPCALGIPVSWTATATHC